MDEEDCMAVAAMVLATVVSVVGTVENEDEDEDDDDDEDDAVAEGVAAGAPVTATSSLSAQRIGFSGRVYRMFTNSAFSLAIRAVTMTVELMS